MSSVPGATRQQPGRLLVTGVGVGVLTGSSASAAGSSSSGARDVRRYTALDAVRFRSSPSLSAATAAVGCAMPVARAPCS
jgi:hypothetical protein